MKSWKKNLYSACLVIGCLFSFREVFSENFEERLHQFSVEAPQIEQLHPLFDLYWDWLMAENPDYATYIGYPGYDHVWPDLSIEAIDRRDHFMNRFLATLTTLDPQQLVGEDRLSYDMLIKDLQANVKGQSYASQYLQIDQLHGIHLEIPLLIGMMPTETVQNYENILSRLKGFPILVDQTIELLNKGLEAGITPPQVAIRHVPTQILNQLVEDPLSSVFLTPFSHFPSSIGTDDQNRLLEAAKTIYSTHVYPALCKLHSYLVNSYIPHCRETTAFSDLPNGQEWYVWHTQKSTTTDLSPQEIHQIGLAEVERIHQDMLDIIASLQFTGSFDDFLQFLRTHPQFFYTDRESLLKGYQDLTKLIESRLSTLFKKLPLLPFEVVPVPAYSEEGQVSAYYYPGSLTLNRPGYFFINVSHLEDSPTWEMEPLALHEAVPGHHLQISLAQELDELPAFRKEAHYTAYIEGWGLYAESLGTELGLYQDPYSKFGRLTYEKFRAIRLVVDTGLHAMGWSRQEAIDYFKKHIGLSEETITTEVDRYLVMPGQALAYKVGELKIKELRQLAAQTLGEKFDVCAFHDEWLRHGALPLDAAEQVIKTWITERLQEEAKQD